MGAIKSFISNIFDAVSENLISGGAYYLIAKAVAVTAMIAVFAWIIAAAAGIAISYLMCYEKRIVSGIGRGICFVFRSIPVLLIVWLLYYCFFGGSTLSGIIIVGLGIGLYGAGHLAEIISIAVKKEQEKMNKSVCSRLEKVYYTMVVPQALEDSLFQIKRLTIHLLQWTTIAGYVSVNDLTEVMYGIGQRTMYPFFSIFFAAILYMIATLLIEWIFKLIGRKLKGEEIKEQDKKGKDIKGKDNKGKDIRSKDIKGKENPYE